MSSGSTALYALALQGREVLAAYRAETDSARRLELLLAYKSLQGMYCDSLQRQLREHDARWPSTRPGTAVRC